MVCCRRNCVGDVSRMERVVACSRANSALSANVGERHSLAHYRGYARISSRFARGFRRVLSVQPNDDSGHHRAGDVPGVDRMASFTSPAVEPAAGAGMGVGHRSGAGMGNPGHTVGCFLTSVRHSSVAVRARAALHSPVRPSSSSKRNRLPCSTPRSAAPD